MSYRPKDWVTGNGYPPGDDYSVGYEDGADSLLAGLKAEGKSFKAGISTDITEWLRVLVESGANGTLVFIPGEEVVYEYQLTPTGITPIIWVNKGRGRGGRKR